MPPTAPKCTVCSGSSRFEHVFEDLSVCRCSRCGHCFTDQNSIRGMEQYEPDYFTKEHRNWFLHPNLKLYGQLYQVIEQHNPHASVLDVGCGNGNFLRFLRKKSKNLSLAGIDMAPNEPTDGIEYLQGDFLEASIERRFDVLVTLAVIEHIVDIGAFVQQMRELGKPGGLVINMTVDDGSIIYGTARILKMAGYAVPLKRLYSKHHLNHFTVPSLQHLLEQHGLATVKIIRHNSPIAAVDIPETSSLLAVALRAGVWAGFQLGSLTQKTMLQTIISQRTV